jgi:hypothetical protein
MMNCFQTSLARALLLKSDERNLVRNGKFGKGERNRERVRICESECAKIYRENKDTSTSITAAMAIFAFSKFAQVRRHLTHALQEGDSQDRH